MSVPSDNAKDTYASRLLPSFGRRKGRALSPRQKQLMNELLPKLQPDSKKMQMAKECWLEIGFGAGEHLHHLLHEKPDVYFIGAEPYFNGVAKFLLNLEENVPDNVAVIADDVRPWLHQQPVQLLDGVYLLFPDPWPKKSHHKRRIVNQRMLDEIVRVLKPSGMLRIATDHVDYSAWMFEQLLQRDDLQWTAKNVQDWHQPFEIWQKTRYQRKTTEQGRLPVFLEFVKSV